MDREERRLFGGLERKMVNMFLPKLNLIELIDLPDENTSQAV